MWFAYCRNILLELNHMHICLILKVKKPMSVGEFRPISLCKVIVKIMTNYISNWLKSLLSVVDEFQGAFVPN